jgi:hypothetical protein
MGQVQASDYSIWTINGSDDVHVTCRPYLVPILESGVDALIREHGGIRYATGYNAVGILGVTREANFVFNLDR